MILKNLFRRKGRTILTLVGIAIGVAAIVALGAMAKGLKAGFSAMSQSSQADLVISQSESLTSLISSVDESAAEDVRILPGVAAVEGMLFSNALIDNESYLVLFGYNPEGFLIEHFRIVEGQSLADARGVRGKSIILGRRVAQSMDLQVGDTLRVTGSGFRVVGIYETGTGFEDSAAVVPLREVQAMTLRPRQVRRRDLPARSSCSRCWTR